MPSVVGTFTPSSTKFVDLSYLRSIVLRLYESDPIVLQILLKGFTSAINGRLDFRPLNLSSWPLKLVIFIQVLILKRDWISIGMCPFLSFLGTEVNVKLNFRLRL